MNNPTSSSTQNALCCYTNVTSKIQVARITNIPNWYFERVVFPGQKLIFEADPEAKLEIHSGMMASSILSDTIPCRKLILEDQAPPEKSAAELQVLEEQNEGHFPSQEIAVEA